MIFAKVSMDRVWALYYMLQMLTNLANYVPLLIPPNSYNFITVIKNVVCFRLLRDKNVQ